MNFIHRTFALIDSDSDCHIDETEVVDLLDKVEVPVGDQLAVRLILKQYLTLGGVLVQQFTEKADVDRDSRVTMEEVLAFDSFTFIEESIPVVVGLGSPSGALGYLINARRSYRPWSREGYEEFVAMWLTSLQVLYCTAVHCTILYCNVLM